MQTSKDKQGETRGPSYMNSTKKERKIIKREKTDLFKKIGDVNILCKDGHDKGQIW